MDRHPLIFVEESSFREKVFQTEQDEDDEDFNDQGSMTEEEVELISEKEDIWNEDSGVENDFNGLNSSEETDAKAQILTQIMNLGV